MGKSIIQPWFVDSHRGSEGNSLALTPHDLNNSIQFVILFFPHLDSEKLSARNWVALWRLDRFNAGEHQEIHGLNTEKGKINLHFSRLIQLSAWHFWECVGGNCDKKRYEEIQTRNLDFMSVILLLVTHLSSSWKLIFSCGISQYFLSRWYALITNMWILTYLNWLVLCNFDIVQAAGVNGIPTNLRQISAKLRNRMQCSFRRAFLIKQNFFSSFAAVGRSARAVSRVRKAIWASTVHHRSQPRGQLLHVSTQ